VSGQAQRIEPCIPLFEPHRFELRDHLPHHRRGTCVGADQVGAGVEVALEGRGRQREPRPQGRIARGRQEALSGNAELLLDRSGDLREEQALRNDEPAQGRASGRQEIE
jgi:hypothetical protein